MKEAELYFRLQYKWFSEKQIKLCFSEQASNKASHGTLFQFSQPIIFPFAPTLFRHE